MIVAKSCCLKPAPRPWCSGNPSACQAEDASSILAGRFSDETKQETKQETEQETKQDTKQETKQETQRDRAVG